jgi:hypothetical protein
VDNFFCFIFRSIFCCHWFRRPQLPAQQSFHQAHSLPYVLGHHLAIHLSYKPRWSPYHMEPSNWYCKLPMDETILRSVGNKLACWCVGNSNC